MTTQEFHRLLAFQASAKLEREHRLGNREGKRFVKGNGQGVGFMGKSFRVVPQIGLEKVIINHK